MSEAPGRPGGDGRPPLSTILFDLRTVIGSLFVVYGVVCVIWGLTSYTAADRRRTGEINLNLWAGIGMLLLAAFFLIWSFTRPIKPPAAAADDRDGDGDGGGEGVPDAGGLPSRGVRPGAHRNS